MSQKWPSIALPSGVDSLTVSRVGPAYLGLATKWSLQPSLSAVQGSIDLNETTGLRSSTALLRTRGPCRIMRECAILADGAPRYPVIGLQGFVHLPWHAPRPFPSCQLPASSPLVALLCYSNTVCLMRGGASCCNHSADVDAWDGPVSCGEWPSPLEGLVQRIRQEWGAI